MESKSQISALNRRQRSPKSRLKSYRSCLRLSKSAEKLRQRSRWLSKNSFVKCRRKRRRSVQLKKQRGERRKPSGERRNLSKPRGDNQRTGQP